MRPAALVNAEEGGGYCGEYCDNAVDEAVDNAVDVAVDGCGWLWMAVDGTCAWAGRGAEGREDVRWLS